MAVNERTLLEDFFAKSIFAFAFSDSSTFSAAGSTAFEAKLPIASKPLERALPVRANPHPSPFEAVTITDPTVTFESLCYSTFSPPSSSSFKL